VAIYLGSNSDGILEPATDTLLAFGTQISPGVWTYTIRNSNLVDRESRLGEAL